ncbi:MAG TPA: glycosyltransferase family 4 protein [Vicinamibacterales bacterium]|nr:glycosyltransferase family 4 protein [Vicinamibacterales bacterium]
MALPLGSDARAGLAPATPPVRAGAREARSKPGGRLRVCHLAYTFYENDNRVIRYAEALAERGAEVDVIALRRPGQPALGTSGRVRVRRIQQRQVDEKRAWSYLLKILVFFVRASLVLSVLGIQKRYDIVHVHNVPDFLAFAALVPRLLGARIILDIHDILPELYAGKFGAGPGSVTFRALLFVERVSCRFAHHVVVSNHLWHAKLADRAVPAARCTTIMNYPDLELFKPLPAGCHRKDGPFIALYPGTLNHHQGVDIAIRAFGLARDRMPDAELHVYGEGPARPQLERLTHELGLSGRVVLLPRLPLEEIALVMAAADVGVVPKRADGFGNEAFSTKVLEFMACGVPVIGARTKVDRHYFDDTLVRFFTPGDPVDLASAMVSVYEGRAGHGGWTRTAREFASRNSWQARSGDYLQIIDSLIAGRAPRPAVAW